jgi:hypothetical protein
MSLRLKYRFALINQLVPSTTFQLNVEKPISKINDCIQSLTKTLSSDLDSAVVSYD